MKKLAKAAAFLAIAGTPLFAFATTQLTSIESLLTKFASLIAAFLPIIMGLAVLVIMWGIFNYIVGAGDEEKRAQAKQYIIWGIIGLFVMVSIWGLVNVLKGSFDLRNTPLPAPAVPLTGCPPGQTGVVSADGKTVTCTAIP